MADNRFVDSVRTAIEDNLAGGDVTIDVCAKQLGVSRRTMQRLLGEVGLTFTSLIDQVRLKAAARLLTDENASVAEIANDLGDTYSTNFVRAF